MSLHDEHVEVLRKLRGMCNKKNSAITPALDAAISALAGGGEAVAWVDRYDLEAVVSGRRTHTSLYPSKADGDDIPLFTSTVGAVRVTDEMVERALAALEEAAEGEDGRNLIWQNFGTEAKRLEVMRAALSDALNPGGSRE